MRPFLQALALLFSTPLFAEKLDYNRDVRPILSDKCFRCHGPDAKNQRSEFRIDSFESATADLGDYQGVVPGSLKESEVHWRIHSEDRTDVMPPPEAKMPLTREEIATLDRWIEEGGEYAEHWSFVPLAKMIAVPEVESDWVVNEIDRFIHARLAEEGVEPSPPTSREKWLRRATLDLTGLPPTLAELDAFLADTSEEAFEEAVERLLDTDAAAERLTAEWLNVARYSDSYGFQVDRDREVWPWRDWVIRAFRQNLPYDQFITWQLAGDLLPGATREQRLATAFNRLHAQEAEGGSVPEEYRIEYVADRIHTYGTAFLGLSMECARCHDHKYDPITAKDYFQLAAFFDNIEEAGLYSFFTPAVPTPTLWLPDEKQESEFEKLTRKIGGAEESLQAVREAATEAFEVWLQSPGESPRPAPLAAFDFDERVDNEFPNLVAGGDPAKSSPNNRLVPGRGNRGKALHLTGDDAVTLPVGNFSQDDPFSISLWMQVPDEKERAVIFSRSKAWTDAASRGYELLLEDGRLSAALIHFYPGNSLRVRARDVFPLGEWRHVTITYDGSSRAAGVELYLDGRPLELEVVRDSLTREITGGGSDSIVIGERMRDNGFKDGLVDDFAVFARRLSPAEVSALAEEKDEFAPDLDYFLARHHEPYQNALAGLRALREERSKLVQGIPEIMAMEELPEPRETFLLDRGHYENRAEAVSADTPGFLPGMKEDAPRNRLGLAQWTTAEDNPLTARVTVNRYWQMLFGRGLVPTSEDFGSQGRPPTHPPLLDWLARDFIDHGWDLRHLLAQIVLSATYRQSSHVPSGELASRDPENTLLYRYPAPRLPAEAIRDNALAASGLLVERVGGPSVKPYDIALSFKPAEIGEGEALYRRSLYTYWRQTAPSPLMITLDASAREICRVRLEKTDSPLQGLVLLNSPQFVEAARTLAASLVERHGERGEGDDALLEEAFRVLTSRRPDAAERDVLRALLSEQTALFEEAPKDALSLIATGHSPPPSTKNPARLAAVTALVSTLMNFDECLTKR